MAIYNVTTGAELQSRLNGTGGWTEAVDGDVLNIADGTYTFTAPVRPNSGLTLNGTSMAGTILNCRWEQTGSLTASNLTFDGNGKGVDGVNNANVSLDTPTSVVLTDVRFTGSEDIGLFIYNASAVVLTDCNALDAAGHIIYITDSALATIVRLTGGTPGASAGDAVLYGSNTSGLLVIDPVITHTRGVAIRTHICALRLSGGTITNTGVYQSLRLNSAGTKIVEGLRVVTTTGIGIFGSNVESPAYLTVRGCHIDGGGNPVKFQTSTGTITISECLLKDHPAGPGILVVDSANVVIHNNTFSNFAYGVNFNNDAASAPSIYNNAMQSISSKCILDAGDTVPTWSGGYNVLAKASVDYSLQTGDTTDAAEVDAWFMPIPGGNCDVGRGSPLARPGVGQPDIYGRPKLSSSQDCVGGVYPQRKRPSNLLHPLVAMGTEIGSV